MSRIKTLLPRHIAPHPESCSVYCTIDGTTPTKQSTLYSKQESITIEKAVTIKAVAVKKGYEDSAVLTFMYTIAEDDNVPLTAISLDKRSNPPENTVITVQIKGKGCYFKD